MSAGEIAERVLGVTREMREELRGVDFGEPVAMVYQPLDYAWEVHEWYVRNFGDGRKRVIFLGMNPGPFGMAQTGVPFGEVGVVRDWMGARGVVVRPEVEHPKRPILGFECRKSEVSGRRLWGLFAERYPRVRDFFCEHYVANFCPLVWMKATGANVTPEQLSVGERREVEEICQRGLEKMLLIFEPEWLVGVGDFAQKRLVAAVENVGLGEMRVGKILHPSPASPKANRGWAEQALQQLLEQGVWEM